MLVDTTGPRTRSRVTRESWWTPWSLGHQRELPGRAGRLRGPSDTGQSWLGEIVDPAGYKSREQVLRDSWLTAQGPRSERESPGVLLFHAGYWTWD